MARLENGCLGKILMMLFDYLLLHTYLILGAMAHIRYYIISEHAYVLTTTKMSQPVKEIVSKLFHLTAITWILKANTLFPFSQRFIPRKNSFEYHSTFHNLIGLRNYFDFIPRNLLLKMTVIF